MAPSQGRQAARVGAGILVTRVLGFVRERVFAQYFGDGPAADAFRAALRIPNVIRNLLGEGTLAASFIPVYAGLLLPGREEQARRVAGTVASLLVLLAAGATLLGIAFAPAITDFAAPGFSGSTRELTIRLVEIMFPMSGILILCGWCLGVLNTHRRFFLSYAAPSVWNIAQIGVLVALGGTLLDVRLAVALAWGALAGSALQLVVQLPPTLSLLGRFHWSLRFDNPAVRRVAVSWLPVVVGAGVYQISSIVETQLASLLPEGAVAILGYAQLVANVPVALFGISVAAAALPELSRDAAGPGIDALRHRMAEGARRVAFFVVPSAFAAAALAPEIIGALFQTGAFGAAQTDAAAGVLAAYAIGLPAQGTLRLLTSGHYALGDTKTPLRIAVVSVAVSAGAAFLLMRRLGPAGIALGTSVAAYVNTMLNGGTLSRRVGQFLGGGEYWALAVTVAAATVAALAGSAAAEAARSGGVWAAAAAGLGAFGVAYLGATRLIGHPEAVRLLEPIVGRREG
jgi:putative peptidoglycan lipid II flippase